MSGLRNLFFVLPELQGPSFWSHLQNNYLLNPISLSLGSLVIQLPILLWLLIDQSFQHQILKTQAGRNRRIAWLRDASEPGGFECYVGYLWLWTFSCWMCVSSGAMSQIIVVQEGLPNLAAAVLFPESTWSTTMSAIWWTGWTLWSSLVGLLCSCKIYHDSAQDLLVDLICLLSNPCDR